MSRANIIQPDQSYTFADYFNLERGFVQLAVEFIALDQWLDSEQAVLQGAVSTGTIWQFGTYNRQTRQVFQDLNLYRVPADVEDLLRILVHLLEF
jgi:hypothetical protein